MIRSTFRAAVIFVTALALAGWYDCLTTHKYVPAKHTVFPPAIRPILDPGQTACLTKVPFIQPAAVLQIFHDGHDFDLIVRLEGKDLPLYQVNHYLLVPGTLPGADRVLCLKNVSKDKIKLEKLEVRNFTAFNSGFPRFYILPRQLVPVRIHPLSFLLSTVVFVLGLGLWWTLSFGLIRRLGLLEWVTPIFLICIAPLIYAITTSLGAVFLSSDRILFLRYEVVLFAALLILIPQTLALAGFWWRRGRRVNQRPVT